MFDKIQHIGIPTTDINQMKNYFIDFLGFNINYETVLLRDKDVRVVFLEYGDLMVEFYEVNENDLAKIIGNIDYIAIYHENKDMNDIITAPGNIRLKINKATDKLGLNYIAINTNDVVGSIEHFQKFGFTVDINLFLRKGKIVLRLSYSEEKNLLTKGYIDHIAIDTQDIEQIKLLIEEKEIEIMDKNTINYLPFFEKGIRYITTLGLNQLKIEFNQIL